MNTSATLRALIDERAAQCPDKPFLLMPSEDGTNALPTDALTFGQLREACRMFETRFHDAGLVHGDVVSMFMGNGIPTATLLLAAMYSGLVANPLNRYTLSARNKLKTNADGSVDLLLQHENPGRKKESNWLPAPSGEFIPMLRLYWPKETPPSILDGTWTIPPVKAVN